MNSIKNPASAFDPWAPDFEVGGGCWIYRHDNQTYTVQAIRHQQVIFQNPGIDSLLILDVNDAAKLMRPT